VGPLSPSAMGTRRCAQLARRRPISNPKGYGSCALWRVICPQGWGQPRWSCTVLAPMSYSTPSEGGSRALRGAVALSHPTTATAQWPDQSLVTSRLPAKRLPLAPVVPQKTVDSLPCPIVDRSQMPWLPCGSRFHMAHGRGVARLTNPEVSYLSWDEVRTNQTYGYKPFSYPSRTPLLARPQPKALRISKGLRSRMM
jgi:hypothetical protein